MAGIDYNLASIDIREKFSFTKSNLEQIYDKISEVDNVLGSVVISTCNRTEIYISCEQDFYINPFELLCNIQGFDFLEYRKIHIIKTGDNVIKHLCELACGVKSQIWGEDQIITQVKNAISTAREFEASDSTLEVMFRNAIAAAKKVKTTVKLSSVENSIAYKAYNNIKKYTDLKKALVIGNGEIGRLMTAILVENGYDTTMTLRHYKYSNNIVPKGANVVEYSDRYEKLSDCDVVISATLSPHHTIEFDKIKNLSKKPKIFIDLAVPRDIDPQIKHLADVLFYDVDSICANEVAENHTRQLEQINDIISKYIFDYKNWCSYKKGLVCV
jgi:glutamyl-tRNA reductase